MNMNVENWELKDSCDEIQWYYQSKLNDDMIACVVIPHKGNHFQWLLRIGFKSTFKIQKLYKIIQTCIKFDNLL